MISTILSLLVMLNPFALFLYQLDIIKKLNKKDFAKLFFKANIITFVLLSVFLLTGSLLFKKIFQVHVGEFRIFGGIVVISYAIVFLLKAEKTLIIMRETLDDTASEVAMPFMIGAGTISVIILISNSFNALNGFLILSSALAANYIIVQVLVLIRDIFNKKVHRTAFDKVMELSLHLNAFFIGAIGIQIIYQGFSNLYT